MGWPLPTPAACLPWREAVPQLPSYVTALPVLGLPITTATIWSRTPVLPGNQPWPPPQPATDLVQLEGDHGDCMEDSRRRPGDGGDALGARALRDGDAGTALRVQNKCRAAGLLRFLASSMSACPTHRPQQSCKPPLSRGTHWSSQTVGSREKVGQESPLSSKPGALGSSPHPSLTCSRIRFTVSPFCRRQK